MRRLITSTLAAIFAVGTITTVHASPSSFVMKEMCYLAADGSCSTQSCKVIRNKKKNNSTGGLDSDDSFKKSTIERINEIERQMLADTFSLSVKLDEKRSALNELLKNDDLTDDERARLKNEFYVENKDLIENIEELRKPYLERIKIVQKNYVDCLFSY